MSGQKASTRLTDPVLTQLALGYENNAFVGELLLPIVDIPKEGVRLPVFGKDAFVVQDDERELHGLSNKVTPAKVTTKLVETTEKDLAYPIDYREGKEADFAYEQFAVDLISEKMALNREKRIATLVSNEGIYAPSNKIVLSGSSQFSHKDSDIFGVFDDAFENVRKTSGKAINRMVIPANVWTAIRKHPQIFELLKRRGLQRLTPALLAEMIKGDGEVDLTIAIGRASYLADLDSEAVPIWSDNIVMGYVPKPNEQGKHQFYKPSFGYTVRRQGSVVVDKYNEIGGKVYNVRRTDNNKEYVLMADAGFLIKAAV